MKREPVGGDHLAEIGYDSKTHTMEVMFTNGAVYEYDNVPESSYRAVLNAPSPGSVFDQKIKKGGYKYRRIS